MPRLRLSLLLVLASCVAHDGAGEPLPLTLAWRALVRADADAAKEEEDAEARRAAGVPLEEREPVKADARARPGRALAAASGDVAQVLSEAAAERRMHTCADHRDWPCCASAAQYLIDAGTPVREAPAYLALASQALDPSRAPSYDVVKWVAAEAESLGAVARYDDAAYVLELFSPLHPMLAARVAGVREQARAYGAEQAAARALTCLTAGDRFCFGAATERSLQLGPNDAQARWLAPLLLGSADDDGLREPVAVAQQLADAGRWAEAIAILERVVELDPHHEGALRQTRAAYAERLAAIGPRLWRARCASCHGEDGAARTKTGQRHHISSMTDPGWHDRWPDASIERAIRNGVSATPMRAFAARFTTDEIAALVMHIRTFRPP